MVEAVRQAAGSLKMKTNHIEGRSLLKRPPFVLTKLALLLLPALPGTSSDVCTLMGCGQFLHSDIQQRLSRPFY